MIGSNAVISNFWVTERTYGLLLPIPRFTCCLSYREGTPRTVLEAMAMGSAGCHDGCAGLPETVTDGENGFLVPVKSVSGLVDAMQRFIENPDLASRNGQTIAPGCRR